jgi:hypothetical protein
MAEQEYHYAHRLLSPCRVQPCILSWKFIAHTDKSAYHGAIANVAYAFGKNNGNVFDEMIFNFQGTALHQKSGNRQKENLPFYLLPQSESKRGSLLFKIIF